MPAIRRPAFLSRLGFRSGRGRIQVMVADTGKGKLGEAVADHGFGLFR
jgi:hypothetical protein